MSTLSGQNVELIPISDIHILNPRQRNKAKFKLVVDSISAVGLKRPIKVSPIPRTKQHNGKRYNLICGQGRLEAFKLLGEEAIPAIVEMLTEEECYIQSLIENLARRNQTTLDSVREIERLVERGYTAELISDKTGLSREYVAGLIRLIREGENRLLEAVERGRIPISIAVDIASTREEDAQAALTEAYERNELRGKRLQTAIKIVKERTRWGKDVSRVSHIQKRPLTAKSLVRHYKQETDRQRTLIRRADLAEARLAVITSSLNLLFADEHFRILLRAEGLDTLPTQLAAHIDTKTVMV